jgi:hypothetical protein
MSASLKSKTIVLPALRRKIESIGRKVTATEVLGWIEACEPRSELNVIITPEIARAILIYNEAGVTNRKLRSRGVDSTVRALKHGMWENTGEPIIFSDIRTLNDGQHRLEAIAEAGIPAIMDLRFGVPRKAFASTNTGRARTAGDTLHINGTADAAAIAIIARWVLYYERGLPGSAAQQISNAEIVAACTRWPDIGDATQTVRGLKSPFKLASLRTLAFLASRCHAEKAREGFFDVIKTGQGETANPAHRYREFLIRNANVSQDRGERSRSLAIGIVAWNLYRDPDSWGQQLRWRVQDGFPSVQGISL